MVTKIFYNWFEGRDRDSAGEEYSIYEVGKPAGRTDKRLVVKIHEHLPCGTGDIYYCRVDFNDGNQERVMNVSNVFFNDNEV